MIEFLKKLIGLKPSIIIDDVDSPFMRVSLKELSQGDMLTSGSRVESVTQYFSTVNIRTFNGDSHWVSKGQYVTIYRR